ncbi:META domain-containing protein [Oceanicoccus sagamiensis]|uniref:DUF306 domain-containing protein n=1 Tax=Oceanicoccus sagamiensis TaxID=716816 RepID=A0A1X9NCJ4_9GAMM|nr:META domain-containing protein [Oceanicoccus sagamiensis]ARN75750.1 hypothetical protein BST96_17535 [Oceanicoccus sagamiensis]
MMKYLAIAFLFAATLTACSMQATDNFKDQLMGSWRIEMIKDRPVIDYSPATLRFDADNRLSGNASCNNFSSTYVLTDARLTLVAGAMTRKMCPAALMDQESRYITALTEVRSGRVDQGMLYLEGEGGALIFKAAPIAQAE